MGFLITSKRSQSISLGGRFGDSKRFSRRLKLAIKNILLSILWLILLVGMSVGNVSGLVTIPDSDRPNNWAVVFS